MNDAPRVVLATGNPGKSREIRQLLGSRFALVLQSDLGVESAEETGLTFEENALIKARHAAAATGLPAIADDSGLEVDALDGAPGVRSARYAGEHASDDMNVSRLLEALAGVEGAERSARFRCVAVYVAHADDPAPLIATGAWDGFIATARRGDNGFGYDPVFIDADSGLTSAELDGVEKNARSHRGEAVRALCRELLTPS
jgi:XTP/dITP diphosphohydrolase